MKKTINILTQLYKLNLKNLINNSNLPIANVYFVTKLTLQLLENTYYGILNNELAEAYELELPMEECLEQENDEQQDEDRQEDEKQN